jgi:hypothetical protein
MHGPFMSAPATLCLTTAIANEMANLERCPASLTNHVDCRVIGDAGSTAWTVDFIRTFFAMRGLPGELISLPPCPTEQAREAGLERACGSGPGFDRVLLIDADSELLVEDFDFRTQPEAPCHDLAQQPGSNDGSGMENASVLYAEAGLTVNRPHRNDRFVEAFGLETAA